MMTAYGTIQNAVQAMRDGAADYLVKPFEAEVLVSKVSELLGARHDARDDDDEGIVTSDPRMQEVLAVARRVAGSDATVLIMGESGVGKEVIFRYIHRQSRRAEKPAVAINCAAIPENMLEAILFGYEKGAFTGAYKACPGKFEQAQGGSLLLDEISEMSLPLQAKLLRVLQERQVERLGSNKLTDLDVRVLATTRSARRGDGGALPRRSFLPPQRISLARSGPARSAGRYRAAGETFPCPRGGSVECAVAHTGRGCAGHASGV